jgi:hypothetical protein
VCSDDVVVNSNILEDVFLVLEDFRFVIVFL